jgi:hypothetical protein
VVGPQRLVVGIPRTVGPLRNRDQKYGHSIGNFLAGEDRRARQIRAPSVRLCESNEKHQVGMKVSGTISKISVLRHHVTHRAGFYGRQFLFVQRGLDGVKNLSLRFSRQRQLGFGNRDRKIRPRSRRVEADRRTNLGIPKLRKIKSGRPGSLHHTHETVRAFNRCFVPLSRVRFLRVGPRSNTDREETFWGKASQPCALSPLRRNLVGPRKPQPIIRSTELGLSFIESFYV